MTKNRAIRLCFLLDKIFPRIYHIVRKEGDDLKIDILWLDIEKNVVPADFPISEYRLEKLKKQNNKFYTRNIAGEFLLRECLLRRGLLSDDRLDIKIQASGKPYLGNSSIHFSISHSGNILVCAVADREIGVDVQKVSSYNPSLAARYFSEDEKRFILSSPHKDKAFTTLWCAKESYIKALGSTLSKDLSSTRLSFDAAGHMYCNTYRVINDEIGDFCLCCCILSNEETYAEINELVILADQAPSLNF